MFYHLFVISKNDVSLAERRGLPSVLMLKKRGNGRRWIRGKDQDDPGWGWEICEWEVSGHFTRWGTQDHSSKSVCVSLSLSTRTKYCVYLVIGFSNGFFLVCDPVSGVVLSFFPVSPSPTLGVYTWGLFGKEASPTLGVYTWGLFGKEAYHCECEDRGSSLTVTSFVYICQVPNLINYQLQIRSWSYQQLVDNRDKNSFLITYLGFYWLLMTINNVHTHTHTHTHTHSLTHSLIHTLRIRTF